MKKTIISGMLAAIAFAMASFMSTISFAADIPVLNFCTAKTGGNYEYTGKLIQAQLKGIATVNVINTEGSEDNLNKIKSGECDAAIVQSDAIYLYQKETGPLDFASLGPIYKEYVHLICRRDSGVTSLDQLNGHKLFSGEVGSGSNVTIRGLRAASKEFGYNSYKDIALVPQGNDLPSLVNLVGGQADCMLLTTSQNSTYVVNSVQKFADKLVLANSYDKYFMKTKTKDTSGKENSVWKEGQIPYSTYDKIMPTGWTGRKNVDTMSVDATVIVSQAWMTAHTEQYGQLGFYLPDIQTRLKVDKKLDTE